MSVSQFLEHQIADPDHTLSGLSGTSTQNIKTLNKYTVDAKLFIKNPKLSEQYYYGSSQHKLTKKWIRNFVIFNSWYIQYFYFSTAFKNGFFVSHRRDRNDKGFATLLYERETLIVLPLEKYSFRSSIEAMFLELNLRSKIRLLC